MSAEEDRLVLASWLRGGPAGQVAARVGVGRRSVYPVLRRLFYEPELDGSLFRRWYELGLSCGLVTGSSRTASGSPESTVDIVCLACHRRVDSYLWHAPGIRAGTIVPLRLGPLVDLDDPYSWPTLLHAYLLLHFFLSPDPIPSLVSLRMLITSNAWASVPRGGPAGPG